MKTPSLSLSMLTLVAATVLWYIMFQTSFINFWVMLTFSTSLLLLFSILLNRGIGIKNTFTSKNIVIGTSSGFLLYLFFRFAFEVVRSFDFMNTGVQNVYTLGGNIPIVHIAIILLFPISMAEEIYWRGLIQRRIQVNIGPKLSWILVTTIYTGVHLPTLNPPLLITAFIGGLVWGYIFMKTGSITAGAISHTIFNLMIFVFMPLGN